MKKIIILAAVLFLGFVFLIFPKEKGEESIAELWGLLESVGTGKTKALFWSSPDFGYIGQRSGKAFSDEYRFYVVNASFGRKGDGEFGGSNSWGIDFFFDLPGKPAAYCGVSLFSRDKIEPFKCEVGYTGKPCGANVGCAFENDKRGGFKIWATGGTIDFIDYTHGVIGAPIKVKYHIYKEGLFDLKGTASSVIESRRHYPDDYTPEKYKLGVEEKVKAVPLYPDKEEEEN